jgi:hypothetical protein
MAAAVALSRDEKKEFLQFIRSMVYANKATINIFTFRKELILTDIRWINDSIDTINGLFDNYIPTLELSYVVDGVNVVVTCAIKKTNKQN